MRNAIFVGVFLLVVKILSCQKIDPSEFEKLKNPKSSLLNYVDEKGNTVGCNHSLECRGTNLVFYQIDFIKEKENLRLQGRIFQQFIRSDSSGRSYIDTVGISGMEIFIAQTVGTILKKVRTATSFLLNTNKRGQFPNRLGDFIVELKFNQTDKLYFADDEHYIIEYDIGKLLRD